ncbi:MAG: hypothetical protein M9947_04455 [Thermomicrobiales bacterium]|nr:hypothetical protein [Thermomicrobiales bacterium]
MGEQDGVTIQLLTGEAIWPDRINSRWPGAQFVARVRIDAGAASLPAAFGSVPPAAIWGVAVELPNGGGIGVPVSATTDRGESLQVLFDPDELLAGDPERVVMAARYWELPWRYVGALREAVASIGIEILDEEPRDDAVTTGS